MHEEASAEARRGVDYSQLDGFFTELDALEKEVRATLSEADLAHLKRIERVGRACTVAGWATAWTGPSLISALLIAQGRTTRWTTVAHHVSHQGYRRVQGVPERYTREGFATGNRRLRDWFDVILPDAWHAEHNQLHHSRLGETADPDLVEENLKWLRESDLPMPVRYAIVAVLAGAWKWIYYAPNTIQEAAAAEDRRAGGTGERMRLLDPRVWDPRTPAGKRLWRESFLPYALFHFALAPAAFLPLGPGAVASAAFNSALAEVITNLHTFLIITTNHAGDDVEAFEGPPADRRDFLYRQIVGSVNYRTGGDLNDLLHGWLNYQIEHHVWPDMTMLQYRRVQPKLRELCERHSVPYVQQSVWRRLKKTVDIMVGKTDMKRQ